MASVKDIGWGSYKNYSGPFYRGKHGYVLPDNPTDDDRILAVITATEGGHYDAINMYDGPPTLSSGLIQFIEGMGQFSVSDMLGAAAGVMSVWGPLQPALDLDQPSTVFGRDERGRWRFFTSPEVVDTQAELNQLMRQGLDGSKARWEEGDKSAQHAKVWAAAVASVWEHPLAQEAQRKYTLSRLRKFAFKESAAVIAEAERVDTPISRAFVAAYLSFAVNNPTRANESLGVALSWWLDAMWTMDWLVYMLKHLTFGPRIAIYPHRYNAIRPKLEQLYGIDLPDMADELEKWKKDHNVSWVISTTELQQALISLGFDLGAHGADGVYGDKTKEAVLLFEQLHEVPHPDGEPDPIMVQRLEQALEARGLSELR
jgi:putative peptidoglycan binding protein